MVTRQLKAVLDLGTNTFHLLIAEMSEGSFIEIFQKQTPVKIGAGGINKGFIEQMAYERGMRALEDFANILTSYSIESIVATGTSAIRNARNGPQFLQEAKERFGFSIESIPGALEAELIFKGVKQSFQFPETPVLIMDIGGGSVEFIIAKNDAILYKQSFEIGAARLLDLFKPSNPIEVSELESINTYLQNTLKPLQDALQKTSELYGKMEILVGSAGSFETLLDVLKLDLGRNYDSITPFAHEVRKEQVAEFSKYIINSTQLQRESMKGVLDFRVDMIVVATVLLSFVVEKYSFNKIIASNYALKEGLLFYSS
ncbi:MAG: exopolyphosphatase [Bacteroidetes bacterium B1(2017)]|nr:MAG: exopolyphosphatase [Bacteroidetes bacterium B1(2017)]